VSDPSGPVLVASSGKTGRGDHVAVNRDRVYLAGYDPKLQVFDASDPSNPVPMGSCGTFGWANDLAVRNGLAYVAGERWNETNRASGLKIIDVSDPTQPVWLSSYTTPGELVDLQADGNTAYVADRDAGLHIIRVYAPWVQPLRLITPHMQSGRVQFTLTGQPGYRVENSTSADLLGWTVATNLLNVTRTLPFGEPAAAGTARFYRATQRP